jgi:hypothetical protein
MQRVRHAWAEDGDADEFDTAQEAEAETIGR